MKIKEQRQQSIKGRDIIVFDEINNGYDLGGKDSPIIVLGYFSRARERGNTSVFEHSVKTGFFGGRCDGEELSEAVSQAQGYAAGHPNFFYTTISSGERAAAPSRTIKANAIALLTFKFMSEYQINNRNLSWVLHEMDGAENTEKIIQEAGEWMKQAKIQRPRESFYKGDHHAIIKLAHNCAHSVAYLSLLQRANGVHEPKWVVDKDGWPYPERRVPGEKKKDLDIIAREFRKKAPAHKIQELFII